jgi:hypothetical protein
MSLLKTFDLLRPPSHLGTDEVIDCRLTDENGVMETAGKKFSNVLSRTVDVQNENENQDPISYTKALTLPGDHIECALAQSFRWRSSLWSPLRCH